MPFPPPKKLLNGFARITKTTREHPRNPKIRKTLKCSMCTDDNHEQTELKTIYTSPETRPLQRKTGKDAQQRNIPKIARMFIIKFIKGSVLSFCSIAYRRICSSSRNFFCITWHKLYVVILIFPAKLLNQVE
jgi:hypothetical protein